MGSKAFFLKGIKFLLLLQIQMVLIRLYIYREVLFVLHKNTCLVLIRNQCDERQGYLSGVF